MPGGPSAPRLPVSHRLVHLEICGSTNSEAMRLAQSGEPLPLWVLADRQTAGRGRSGRPWQSLSGNLLASLALPLRCELRTVAELSLVAGNALVDAVRGVRPDVVGLRLKWPNDVLLGSAKLGGILVESAVARHGLLAVVGIGLNVAASPTGFERPATHLGGHVGDHVTDDENDLAPLEMLGYVGDAMHNWLAIWDEGRGLDQVRAGWLERAGPLGEALTVNSGARSLSGAFAGLDPSGALLLRDGDGRIERFTFGDVTLA